MSEVAAVVQPSRENRWAWVVGTFLRPRSTFNAINASGKPSWLLPMLILSVTSLVYVIGRGWVTGHLAAVGEAPLPPDWQYWGPELQEQYLQAQQATQGPVFLYVIPALGALTSLWMVWVLVGSLLRLTITLLGGLNSATAMNVAAWAALPFALRDLLRAGYVLIVQQPIMSAGLSGFISPAEGGILLFAQKLLVFADVFTLWYIVLLIIGVRAGNGVSLTRAITAVLVVVLLVLALRAGLAMLSARAGGLMITRPLL